MSPAARWIAALTSAIFANVMLFGAVAILIGHTPYYTALESVPVKLIRLAPKEAEKPPPPKKKPKKKKKKKKKKIEKPKPPEKEIVGLSKEKEPEPPKIEEEPEPEPDYQPLHTLSSLPSFARQVAPVYPESERFSGREAKVTVEISIDVTGSVRSIRIIKSGGEPFDKAVMEAVKNSLFTPAYQGGRPVATRVQIPYTFRLR